MAQPTYSCPRCSGGLTWMPQYAKWYCYRCGVYPFDAQTAAATASPVDPASASSSSAKCPTCQNPLSYIGEYKAWYCHSCRKYAAVADTQHSMARCPTCGNQLTFSPDQQKWYCYSCKKYLGEEASTAAAGAEPPAKAGTAADATVQTTSPATQIADAVLVAPTSEVAHTAPATAPDPAPAGPPAPSTPEQLMMNELKRSRIPKKEERKPEVRKETIIEDVFLLYNDGRLIRHYTRRLKPTVDSEILSSMLVAVSAFVKDSRISEDESEGAGLDEIKYGALRIHLARGKYVTVAMLIQGEDAEGVVSKARKKIHDIETENESIVKAWDGRMNSMLPVHKHVESLFG